jgi:hypothetical protein
MKALRLPLSAALFLLGPVGCSSSHATGNSKLNDATAGDAGMLIFGDNPAPLSAFDASAELDAAADAFFINDPAPPMCGPNGDMTSSSDAGGPVDCPSDKNRQGCPCDKPNQKAACWPGKRVNRNHGICTDGMTTCVDNVEFGAAWGPCEGYVLPVDGAIQGADACRCFSNGEWAISNLVPCIYHEGDTVHVTSSRPDDSGGFHCDPDGTKQTDWSPNTLNVECAGQFKLCYTLKAGDVEQPKNSDCVLHQECLDVWYPEPSQTQTLMDLPGWSADDDHCAQQFADSGGYGEMSVLGTSIECDAVDDGKGQPYVFKRTRYCSTKCPSTPDAPECRACGTGGSGRF